MGDTDLAFKFCRLEGEKVKSEVMIGCDKDWLGVLREPFVTVVSAVPKLEE